MHAVYLTKIFRERFGVSLGTYQRRRRLEWAAGRLSAGESVADVAHRAGFADQAHFTRAFKRFSGQTPGRFRWERTGRQRAELRPELANDPRRVAHARTGTPRAHIVFRT